MRKDGRRLLFNGEFTSKQELLEHILDIELSSPYFDFPQKDKEFIKQIQQKVQLGQELSQKDWGILEKMSPLIYRVFYV